MAIDTRDKRSSAMSLGPWLYIGPTPDGAISGESDRQHCAFTYRGVSAGIAPDVDHWWPIRGTKNLWTVQRGTSMLYTTRRGDL